jgi:hypothetical protein
LGTTHDRRDESSSRDSRKMPKVSPIQDPQKGKRLREWVTDSPDEQTASTSQRRFASCNRQMVAMEQRGWKTSAARVPTVFRGSLRTGTIKQGGWQAARSADQVRLKRANPTCTRACSHAPIARRDCSGRHAFGASFYRRSDWLKRTIAIDMMDFTP